MESNRSLRLWDAIPVLVAALSFQLTPTDGIRVYAGTKYQDTTMLPAQERIDAAVNVPVITKRSWEPTNVNLEPSAGADRKLSDDWREIDRRSTSVDEGGEKILKISMETKPTPSLYKMRLTQRGYIQFLRYLANVPPIQEYTFCLWFTSSNLSHPHPLFSYSLHEKERVLGVWVNPADSTIQMGIRDEIIFKIPVRLRENRWYHVCQSWSGLLGEWMLFLDGKKKGSGVLPQYQGTFVPGGGDVVVGQELTNVDKGLDDGIEGEIFGFNMVDESVDFKDQATFINPHYRPNVQPQGFVPPFKSLPPIKKSFHEIKAYLSKLPSDPNRLIAQGGQQTLSDIAVEPNLIQTAEEVLPPQTRFARNKSKMRYKPPMRKVVVYNRQDRQLRNEFDSHKLGSIQLVKKTGELPVTSAPDVPDNDIAEPPPRLDRPSQLFDENYSVHSYRAPKKKIQPPSYEIYEAVREEGRKSVQAQSDSDYDGSGPNERKTRHNFDLYSAREAHKTYPLSGNIRDLVRPKLHFEIRREGKAETTRRSFDVDESPGVTKRSTDGASGLPDFIPVYEVIEDDTPYRRKKREARRDLKRIEPEIRPFDFNFRPLPDIPESFINLFTQQTTKSEMEAKLSQFFPENSTQIPVIATTNAAANTTPNERNATFHHILESTKATIAEEQTIIRTPPGWGKPQNFPDPQELEKLTESSKDLEVGGSRHGYSGGNRRRFVVNPKQSDANVEKGRFDISSGTELVLRSYGLCGLDRGSPVRNKKHLIVSWSDTPVRIYGGAMVANAKNVCGHF